MSVKFRLVKRKVLLGEDAGTQKMYAYAKKAGTTDVAKLGKLVGARSSLSEADIKSVIDSLIWVMGLELASGFTVRFGDFGTFRLTLKSEGVYTDEKFSAHKIQKARIRFVPGKSLTNEIRNVTFEPDDVKEVEVVCDRPHTI